MTPSPTRGPSGAAAGPPGGLAGLVLPLEIVRAGTVLYRFHSSAYGPVFFGPGRGKDPIYRFDSAAGLFGVLYVGIGYRGAMIETLLRNPGYRYVIFTEIAQRSVSTLAAGRDLKLAQLYGAGLQKLGLHNDISTGPYDVCGAWADALWSHPAAPDGLMYHSRHDPSEICVALFERPDLALQVASTTRLVDDLATVSDALKYYGKEIAVPDP